MTMCISDMSYVTYATCDLAILQKPGLTSRIPLQCNHTEVTSKNGLLHMTVKYISQRKKYTPRRKSNRGKETETRENRNSICLRGYVVSSKVYSKCPSTELPQSLSRSLYMASCRNWRMLVQPETLCTVVERSRTMEPRKIDAPSRSDVGILRGMVFVV
ncbi:Uncharacterized protein DBV15_07158 [Temnothorax longispinosus]|uniref:Uncharacterized protein n=1 Tax=Temnothorax longispinosus TaxID=300112 RepID=A0A4V3SAQ3_9HYME|nr:Uncharacterized protein DBV15_07158 [Temnothorax longispinosus]